MFVVVPGSSGPGNLPIVKNGGDIRLGAAILEALPHATLLLDLQLRVVHANAAARAMFGAAPGGSLGSALGCAEPRRGCGDAARCEGCVFFGAVKRALAGEQARARGFVLRTSEAGEPADLHLLAAAAPLERGEAEHAVLVIEDADRLLTDPGVVRVCAGCGRVQDEEGQWHALHRYLEDHIGLDAQDALCATCARESRRRV